MESMLICMPCYGGLVSDKTSVSLFNLAKLLVKENVDHAILASGNESSITLGRSKMANFFVNNTKFEYLFFLDSDVGFDPNDVLKLLRHKKDLVSGAYPMKTLPLAWNFTLKEPPERQGDLVKINSIGIGFTMIHRSVFKKISNTYGKELKYIPTDRAIGHNMTQAEKENSYHYFAEIRDGYSYLPEDMSFFFRAKSCGIPAWMDVSINLCHVGSHVYQE